MKLRRRDVNLDALIDESIALRKQLQGVTESISGFAKLLRDEVDRLEEEAEDDDQ